MKNLFLVITFFFSSFHSKAQTVEEWTKQKKTQIKYLVQQIGLFQTHLNYVKAGYVLIHKGTDTIGKSKTGEWRLHKNFFASLKKINSSIRRFTKVTDIINMQVRIVKHTKSLVKECKESNQFTTGEESYIEKVCDYLLSETLKNLNDLVAVLTANELAMKDDERINRIEKIYEAMHEREVFLNSFGRSAFGIAKNRQYEQFEIELSKKVNNVK